MQSKGAIRLVAILLMLASIWQLSFTLVNSVQENKAEKYAEAKAVAAENSAAFSKVADVDKAFYIDSVKKVANRMYIDSISSEKIYFGYTYKDVQAKSINLGLDLKGGMNVMLQVQLEDLVRALSKNNQSVEFNNAIALAKENQKDSREDFITLFSEAWEQTSNGLPLAHVFGTIDMVGKIGPESTDAEVIEVIRAESESAIANSFNVLRNRIDRFGVTQPNIQKLGNSGRILVELPGVKEPERVRKLLQGTASLEFWPTFNYSEVKSYLDEANALLAEILVDETVVEETPAAEADSLLAAELEQKAAEAELMKQNPLYAALIPAQFESACIGYAHYADTAKVNKYLAMPQVKALFPAEFKPMWTVHASAMGENIYELVAIKAVSADGKAPLDGGYVTDARVQFGTSAGTPEVSMAMNGEGAGIWSRLTGDNVGKQIAIVLDGMVYSYPNVNGKIDGGVSQITGKFSLEEAEDLANVLKSGKLPAPATIIQEQVVGPSLGAESINAGMISFIIAFILVLIYMVLFYAGAGLVADIALLCNVVLLFGTLVSFGAVLTLPGIAGLVLTLGMAVDANVIIYERVKEELRAGKGLSKAIADGYSNAYSAIIDGQVTTLLTGFVLFVFGSGPVQGFATTLIIGIITSMVTSIFITRLIFDDRVEKGKNVTFDNKFTRNFLQNTKVDFIGKKKIAYILSGALILISVLSISIKGFTYGVDFTGGRTYVVRFDQPAEVEAVRAAVNAAFDNAASNDETVDNAAAEVKQFGGDSQIKITTTYKVDNEASEVDTEVEGILYEALKGFYAEEVTLDEFTSTQDNPNGIVSSDKVGPTIASLVMSFAIVGPTLSELTIPLGLS